MNDARFVLWRTAMRDLQHPEITWIERTGHPSWCQLKEYHCEECGCELYLDEIYEDMDHDFLCEDCLLKLHHKSPWE